MSTEKERESYVYMAKLAEQAERYDGASCLFLLASCSLPVFGGWTPAHGGGGA
jgi:hypothetical protein